jgi:hypothetical protein
MHVKKGTQNNTDFVGAQNNFFGSNGKFSLLSIQSSRSTNLSQDHTDLGAQISFLGVELI